MNAKFYWTDKENFIGEVAVTESNPEELARFFTRFSADIAHKTGGISVEKVTEDDTSLKCCVQAYYVNNDYYLREYGTPEEYSAKIEEQADYLLSHTDYTRDTNTTLMDAIVRELKKEGLYDKFQAIEEYYLPSTSDVTTITDYQFDIVSYVNYGSEGTWLSCYLSGKFDAYKDRRISLGTFKTLHDDLEASLILGELGGAIAYIGHKYINQDIDRFSPEKER